MALKDNKTECMVTCLGVAAFAGLVTMIMLYWMGQFGAIQAFFTGGLLGTATALILIFTFCRTQKSAKHIATNAPGFPEATGRAGGTAGATGLDAEVAGVSTGPAGIVPGTAGTTPGAAGEVGGGATSATNRTESVGGPEAGTLPEGATDTSAPTGTTAAVSSTTAALSGEVKAKPAAEQKADPAGSTKSDLADTDIKPATLLNAAGPEGKDDLKLISGVGPKLEQTLNDLGVYHFGQVAKWEKADIAWVDANLRFKGRIERDDWMSQAKLLAEGGETDFSKKKKS